MEKEDSKELMEDPLAAMGLAQDEATHVYREDRESMEISE